VKTRPYGGPSATALLSIGLPIAGPVLAVAATAVALWLATGVRLGEIAVFATYEFTFVFLPGWLVYRAFSAPGGRLREIVFGWSLGYVLEILAFLVTAELGVRDGFSVYPIVVGTPAALLAWRRRAREAPLRTTHPGRAIWVGAGLCMLLLAYAAAVGFSQTPLPRGITSATYQEDTVFVISLAADALHHWPMTLPTVSGEPLNYHLFAFMHFAAVSQVTGIDLSVVIMRLYEVPLLVLLALSLVLAGRRIGRTWGAGLAALAVVLFLGELDSSTGTETGRFLFRDLFFYWLLASHTFLLGLVFFVPVLVIVADIVGEKRAPKRFEWALLAAFLVGCVGTKSYCVLVVGGALFLFLLWHAWRQRRLHGRALAALGVTAVVYLVANVAVFGWNSAGARVSPFRNLKTMFGVEELNTYFEHLWSTSNVPAVVAVPYGVFGLLGVTIVGVVFFLRYRSFRLSPPDVLFLACPIIVLPILFLSSQPGFGQMFLVFFGLVPGTILAADGYRLLWLRHGPGLIRQAWPVLAVAAGVVLVGALVAGASPRVALQVALFVCVVAAAVGGAVSLFAPRFGLRAAGATWVLGLLLLGAPVVALLRGVSVGRAVAATALMLAAVSAGLILLRRRSELRSGLAGAVVGGVLILGILNTPLDWFPKLAGRALDGEAVYNQRYSGLTSGLYEGLTWIRDHTSPNAVLAVNNHSLSPDQSDSKYFYYSAFAERRIELESWDYSEQTIRQGYFSLPAALTPFPRRLALANAVFHRGDEHALRTLAREFDVSYLVADKVHGTVSPVFAELVPRVFSNDDIDVYAVGRPGHWLCHSSQGAGITADFGHKRTPQLADHLRKEAENVGFAGLTIQRRGCFDYAVVLLGLQAFPQAKDFRAEAARVGFAVKLECRSSAPTGGTNAVFGHRRTKRAAQRLAAQAASLGFGGLVVRQDACGDWEVDRAGLATAERRRLYQAGANSVGLHVTFEPG
jgi:hypothetical protein